MNDENIKIVARNRKARHDYHIDETLEAGLVLTGTEIKSIRAGRVSLQEAFVTPRNGEMWVIGMHIAPYDPGARENHDPVRPRKLLMHRREIDKWTERVQIRGMTIVPLQLHIRRGRAKLQIGLAKGKRQYDKRQDIAKRDAQRRMDRELSRRG